MNAFFACMAAVLFTLTLQAKEEPINPTVAHFFYSPNYDEPRTACDYKPEPNTPYDFHLTCVNGGTTRIFDVHIAVTHLDDTTAHPRAFVEILYWIQDLGSVAKPHSLIQYGSTVRLNSVAMHGMQALDVSQDLGSAEQLHFELRLSPTLGD